MFYVVQLDFYKMDTEGRYHQIKVFSKHRKINIALEKLMRLDNEMPNIAVVDNEGYQIA